MIRHVPIIIIIAPLTGAIILELISKFNPSQRLKDIITLAALTLPVILLLAFTPRSIADPIYYELGGWEIPYGIVLVMDNLSVMMSVLVGIVTLTTFIYSLESKEMLPTGDKYYFLFLFMTTGLYGVFLTGDLIMRYEFFEVTVLATYVLLTYTKTKESLRASFYYLIIGSVSTFLFLVGIGLIYFNVGFLDLKEIGETLPTVPVPARILIFSFFMVTIGVKSGLVPFHTWLPDAHVSAPTPITAVLAGLTVKVGLYMLFRTIAVGFAIPAILNIVIFFGLITGIIGSLMTFKYWDIKRILTWHTIAQVGLITACVGLWTPSSVSSALYHMVNHSIFKPLLFLSAGAIIYLYGSGDIRKISLKNGHPILASTFLIGLLALIGIPPLNGFYSKAFMIESVFSRPLILIPFVIIHIIIAASVFRIIYYASRESEKLDAPVSMLKPLIILAGLTIFIGTTTSIWMNNIIGPGTSVLVSGSHLFTGSYIELSTLWSKGGLTLLLTLPIAYVIRPVLEEVKNIDVRRVISEVSLTDGVRYVLIGQGIVVALLLLY